MEVIKVEGWKESHAMSPSPYTLLVIGRNRTILEATNSLDIFNKTQNNELSFTEKILMSKFLSVSLTPLLIGV